MKKESNLFDQEIQSLEKFTEKIDSLSHRGLIEASKQIATEFRKILKQCSILVKTGDSTHRKMIKIQTELNSLNTILEKQNAINDLEISMATEIQQGLLPPRRIQIKDFHIIYSIHYLHVVGGDFVEILEINQDNVAVLIADASGHGIPAAMMTMLIKLNFLNNIMKNKSPKHIFKKMNETFDSLITTSDYFTAFLLILSAGGKITYSNAGHKPILLYRKKLKTLESLSTDGMFVGLIPDKDSSYSEKSTHIEKGDRLFMFTDGLVDSRNVDLPDETLENYISLIEKNIDLPLEKLHDCITSYWKNQGGAFDDVTYLLLEYV